MGIEELKKAYAIAEARALALQDAVEEAQSHADNIRELFRKADEERMDAAAALIAAMRGVE